MPRDGPYIVNRRRYGSIVGWRADACESGSLPAVCAVRVLAKGAIPIPGARDGEMAAINMRSMGWRLRDEEVAELEAAADAVGFEFSSGGFKLE